MCSKLMCSINLMQSLYTQVKGILSSNSLHLSTFVRNSGRKVNSRDQYEKLWLLGLLKTTLQKALVEYINLNVLAQYCCNFVKHNKKFVFHLSVSQPASCRTQLCRCMALDFYITNWIYENVVQMNIYQLAL